MQLSFVPHLSLGRDHGGHLKTTVRYERRTDISALDGRRDAEEKKSEQGSERQQREKGLQDMLKRHGVINEDNLWSKAMLLASLHDDGYLFVLQVRKK
jgi:hypothetical protein